MQNKHLIKTPIFFKPTAPFKKILNLLNHKISRVNIKNNPQLIIFSFDHIGLSINLHGRYEVEILNLLEVFIKQKIPDAFKNTALDIGANIGNHSIFFSKLFKKVISFEPNPATFDVLALNIKYNAPNQNIIPHRIGLSDANGDLPFILNRSNIGGSRIQPDFNNKEYHEKIRIKVNKADNINSLREEKISLIKVDVEGHEINVFKGAEELIKQNKPAIIFEQGKDSIINGTSDSLEFLLKLGYEFYSLKNRFYFGESFIGKLLAMILHSFLGYQLSFVETSLFPKRFYEIILAFPKEEKLLK